MRRRLKGFERAMWMAGQYRPVNFALVARVQGSLPEDLLRSALDKIQVCHPLTNVRITVDAEGNPSFTDKDVHPIPLQVMAHHDATDWTRLAERELLHLFDWETGPFMRVVWRRGQELSELVLVYHHMVADGLSGAYLLRDLLAYVGDPDEEVESLDPLPPITELLPAQAKSTTPAKAIVDAMIAEARQSDGQSMTVGDFLSLPPPSLRVLKGEMDAVQAARLASRCRREETSVHGAIGAAYLLAFAEHEPHPNDSLRTLQSPVNVRAQLVPPVGEDFGLFISHVTAEIDCSPQRGFWQIARDVRNEIRTRRNDPALLGRTFVADALFELDNFEEILETLPIMLDQNYDLSLTNLGRLEFPPTFGGLRLEAVYGPVLAVSPGETVVGVNSFNGQIRFTMAAETHLDREPIQVSAARNLANALKDTAA